MGRVITAMVTPFTEDGTLDAARAGQLARRLVDMGSDGILVNGTTGESPTLSESEKLAVLQAVLDSVGGDAFVWMGTGSNSTEQTVLLTQKAEREGAHGVMVVAPYYNKPSQMGLFQHFSRAASSTGLPVMIYNIPGRTSINLEPSTFASLVEEHDNMVAIKEASGNLDQVSEMRRLTAGAAHDVAIYSGDDSLTLPILAVGGRGIVSVASHLVAGRIRDMVLAFEAGKPAEAERIHRSLLVLFKALFVTSNPVPVKWALGVTGFPVGGVRLPLVGPSEDDMDKVRCALETVELMFPTA